MYKTNCISSKDGPTSQHDTIELRGFEDTPTDKTKKKKGKLGKWGLLFLVNIFM